MERDGLEGMWEKVKRVALFMKQLEKEIHEKFEGVRHATLIGANFVTFCHHRPAT